METTVNLSLPLIMPSQAQKHVTHNEALIRLDGMMQLAVIDRDLTAPPAAPAEGQRYIVAGDGDDEWAGKAGQIALRHDGIWLFFQPAPGWIAYVVDEGALTYWTGSAWAAVSPPLGSQTLTGLLTTNGQVSFPATQNASAGANVLDDYEEGTFAPGLAFGGASAGIAYATQTGTYTKVGNLVYVHTCYLALSAKGTSTGHATITGLPFPVTSFGGASAGYYAGFSGLGGAPVLLIDSNAAGVRMYNPGAAAAASLTEANFTDNSQFRANFAYRTN